MKKLSVSILSITVFIMSSVSRAEVIVDSSAPLQQVKSNTVTVYKSPFCGCCEGWVKYLKHQGFTVTTKEMDDVSSLKDSLNVPEKLRSCHTAQVNGYVIEGHVPVQDIKRLLRSSDKRISGIAVPNMTQGTPGMETGRKDPFMVIAFDKEGNLGKYNEYTHY